MLKIFPGTTRGGPVFLIPGYWTTTFQIPGRQIYLLYPKMTILTNNPVRQFRLFVSSVTEF